MRCLQYAEWKKDFERVSGVRFRVSGKQDMIRIMDASRNTAFTFVLFSIFIFCQMTGGVFAQEGAELEEILSGFEDNQKSDEDLQEVMEGFDDEAPGEKKKDKTEAEEVLEGFDEDTKAAQVRVAEQDYLPDFLNLDGYFKLGSSYNMYHHQAEGTDTDWHGLSRLRAELMLELDARFSKSWQARVAGHGFYDFAYRIQGRDKFTQEVLDENESELEFGEVWLLGSITDQLDLKAGRQIVVWGKSDNIRVTDVLNPLDLREPGLTDLENLRLPVTMTKLDYFLWGLNLSGIVIHEVRYNKNPEFGSDFFPAAQPLPTTENPDTGFDIDNTQFALALHGIFHGWDASLYGAYFYDDTPHRDEDPGGSRRLKHARLKMIGGAFNIAMGNWLFKTEAAFFDGIQFFNSNKDYNRIDALAGLEYSGFSDTTISFELADRHILDFNSEIEASPDFAEEDRWVSALRLTRTFLNETLSLTVLAQTFGLTGDDGAFQRFTAEYDLTDAIEITGGVVFYQSGDLPRFRDVGQNDRLYLEFKYNF
jgi:hypothetical protein